VVSDIQCSSEYENRSVCPLTETTLFELRDLDGFIDTFTMTGKEMQAYALRVLKEVGSDRMVISTKEAVSLLEGEFNYKIRELF